MTKIAPCLWFNGNAEEAAHFYAATFPNSHINAIHRTPADYPNGKAGDTLTVEFPQTASFHRGIAEEPKNATALRDALFEEDALFFVGLESCSLRYGADDGPQIRVDFPDFPDLGVWTKPGADYICIEPWQGFNDPADFDGDLGEKPGMLVLAAGAEWRSTMTLTLEDDEQ